jgi:hypothetical protein
MSNYATVAAEAGDKYLATLAQGQDSFIEYVRASRDLMPGMMVSEVPKSTFAPFTIPTMLEVANLQFNFANKLLEQQRRFFAQLYSGTATRRSSRSAPVKASTSRSKRSSAAKTAKKTTSKSASAGETASK